MLNMTIWYVATTALPISLLLCLILLIITRKQRQNLFYPLIALIFVGIAVQQYPVVAKAPTVVESVACSLLETLKIFTMNSEINYRELTELISGYEIDVFWRGSYRVWNTVAHLMAPVLTISIVIRLLGVALDRAWYKLCRNRPAYFFSELNEGSYTLAKSIYERHQGDKRPPYLVFCKINQYDDGESDDDYRFREAARQIRARFTTDTISDISYTCLHNRKRKKGIFLIDVDEGENVLNALRITAQFSADTNAVTPPDIYVFSTEDSAEELIDGITKCYSKNDAGKKKKGRCKENVTDGPARFVTNDTDNTYYPYTIRLVNHSNIAAQELLLEYPLYCDLKKEQQISLVVVGCGEYGMAVASAAMSTGVMNSYRLKVRLLDISAEKLESQFVHKHPDFFDLFGKESDICHIDLAFCSCNVEDTSFDDVLNKHCKDANYIVVSLGDDEKTMETALFLYRWYYQKALFSKRETPNNLKIFANIKNNNRATCFKDNNYKIKIFGSTGQLYDIKLLENRLLDRLGWAINYVYEFKEDSIREKFFVDPQSEYATAKTDFYKAKIVDQRSSQMAALHGFYKLKCLGITSWMKNANQEQTNPEELLKKAACAVLAKVGTLYVTEHNRWCVFQTLEGYRPFPLDIIMQEQQPKHKNAPLRLHGCIVSDAELEQLGDCVNRDLRRYDQQMCNMCLFCLREYLVDFGDITYDATTQYMKKVIPDNTETDME